MKYGFTCRRAVGLTMLAIVGLALLGPSAAADEGMWLLSQIGSLNLRQKGLKIDPREVYRPDGPCLARACVMVTMASGAFVSDRGLVLTNHHVAFGAIQRISAAGKKNYVRDGYLARTLEEEIRAPGYTVTVTLRCEDVTKKVLEGLEPDATEAERSKHVRARMDEVVKAARREESDRSIRFRVKEVFDGAGYTLYATRRYRDVRLVYAPPAAVGEFGGDPDNWMWPRHCGDFTFLRVYAKPNGEPAGYAKDNVPFKPEVWLELSTAGVKEGDFTFILGHPARTYRHRTSYYARYHRDVMLPTQIKRWQARREQIEASSKEGEGAALRNLSTLKGVLNGLKNFQGKVEWMRKKKLVEAIRVEEEDLLERVRRRAALKREYGHVLDDLGRIYDELEHREKIRPCLDRAARPRLMRVARVLHELSVELEKPDEQRSRRYREDRLGRLRTRTLRGLDELDVEADRDQFVKAIRSFADLPEAVLPPVLAKVVDGKTGAAREDALERFAKKTWKGSKLAKPKVVTRYLSYDAKKLEKLKDPLVRFAAALADIREKVLSAGRSNTRLKRSRRRLYEARRALKCGPTYPDADSSLRFTYGTVRGYRARDAVRYDYITSLAGVMEKETGREPFASPPRLLELYDEKDFGRWVDKHVNCVPVAFVHGTDITGGNSGSPVLNARGKMIGIAFDGNWEAITSDYRFEPDLTRTISVDIRYVLFITEKLAGAGHLLEEMGIKRGSL